MHLIQAFAVLSTISATVLLVQANTYYIDESCTNRTEWQGAWDLAMTNARSVVTRLSSDSDTDFERIRKIIFKADRSDDVIKRIKEPFEEILTWTETPRRENNFETLKPAYVRIFCDNDAMKAPDNRDPEDVHGTDRWRTQTALDKVKRYVDDKNYMKWLFEEPWCRRNSKEGVVGKFKGHTDFDRLPIRSPYGRKGKPNIQYGQNEERVVITLCEHIFTLKLGSEEVGYEQLPLIAEDIDWDNLDYDLRRIAAFEYLIAHTILHELIHAARPYIVRDGVEDLKYPNGIGDFPDMMTAYNWQNIKNMDYETAIRNADSYAEMGLWAMLADNRYSLQRVIPDMSLDEQIRKEEVEDEEKKVQAGCIRRYSDITARALRMIARWFTA